ncbi:MAG TPA: hypothetical protein VGS19_01095 [Streptosporangiaceae bacterium]|nr:hypothetical protein [Streptosporangiaceae bacterium]
MQQANDALVKPSAILVNHLAAEETPKQFTGGMCGRMRRIYKLINWSRSYWTVYEAAHIYENL